MIDELLALFILYMCLNLNTGLKIVISPSGQVASLEARHVDLIEALQLWNTSYPGLTIISGPRPFAPAVFLQGRNLFSTFFSV